MPGVDPDSVRIYGPTQYQGGFKTLHDKGTIKITNYHEDLPIGGQGNRSPRPTTTNNKTTE